MADFRIRSGRLRGGDGLRHVSIEAANAFRLRKISSSGSTLRGADGFRSADGIDLGSVLLDAESSVSAGLVAQLSVSSLVDGESQVVSGLMVERGLAASVSGDSEVLADLSGASALLEAILSNDSYLSDLVHQEFSVASDAISVSYMEADIRFEVNLEDALLSGESSAEASMGREVSLSVVVPGESIVVPVMAQITAMSSLVSIVSFLTGSAVTFTPVGFIRIAPLPPYRVVITDLEDNPLEEIPFNSFSYGFVLNDAGIFELSMPMQHPKATPDLLAPGQRHVHIRREGQLVWGGDLWFAGASTTDENLRIQGEGWFSRFRRRHVDERIDFENEDQVDIAWDLIAFTQGKVNGNMGISRGSTPATGITRTRKLKPWNRQKISDIILGLTVAKNGFDFEITPDKVFNTFYPLKQEDNGYAFELGKNVESLAYDIDASAMATELSGMGSGGDRNRCIAVVTNLGAQGAYGLLQDSADFSNIRHYDNLVDITKEQLRLMGQSRWQPSVVARMSDPRFGEFDVGDLVRVKAKRGFIDVNKKFRIVGYTVRVNQEGHETVDVTFDQELAAIP